MVFGERFSYDDKQFLELLHVIAEVLRFNSSFLGQVSGGGGQKKTNIDHPKTREMLQLKNKLHCPECFHRCTTSFPGSWSMFPAPSTPCSAILTSWGNSSRKRSRSTKNHWTPAPRGTTSTPFSSGWSRLEITWGLVFGCPSSAWSNLITWNTCVHCALSGEESS